MIAKSMVAALLGALVLAGAAQAEPGPALRVDASADRHAISPEIYGLNFADVTLARQIALPVDRTGGDDSESYNYVLGSRDSGQGNYFENLADCFNECTGGPYTPAYQSFVAADRARGTRSLMQLPLMGYIAKDAPQQHPATCGFPKSVFGDQQAFDPFDSPCGNGISGGGSLLHNPTPTRGGQAVGAAYSAQFAADLRGRGVDLYEPGNEPALWSSTHRDLHVGAETNTELLSKFTAVASAVKAQQPAAEIVGPSEWGWIGYFCDEAGFFGNGGSCHPPQGGSPGSGETPAVAAFLDAMRAYQEQHGVRLLDYFDLHYYPQADGLSTDETRSLWDPSYKDPSYIDSVIRLIPRMHEWVDQHYPGTKLAITEYNFDLRGADPTLGMVLQADALGIFARERVDLATLFDGPSAGSPVADAFRLYRSYDGAGGRFGTTYVGSSSDDEGRVAVYGARRDDGALTVAIVNKAATAQTSRLALAGFAAGGASQVWQSTGGGIAREADLAVSGGGVTAELPARSISLLVVPPAAGTASGGAAGGGAGGGGGGGGGPAAGGTGSGRAKPLKVRSTTRTRDGSVTLSVDVPAAGTLRGTATVGSGAAARARTVGRGSATASAARRVTLRIRSTSAGRSYLHRHRKGVRATLRLTFTPKRKGTVLRTSRHATLRVRP